MKLLKLLPALSVVVLFAADAPKEDATKKDLEKMQGTWAVVSQEFSGTKLTEEMIKQANVTLVVKDQTYTILFGTQQVAKGKIKLDATKKPKQIDGIDDKGMTMLGIYEIDGDMMKVNFAQPGNDRPTELATKEKSMQILIGYKRVSK